MPILLEGAWPDVESKGEDLDGDVQESSPRVWTTVCLK